MFTNINTADKEDSKGQDELEMKLKNANLAEWSVDDLKSVLAKLKLKGTGVLADLDPHGFGTPVQIR